jgi:hypothetical protein
VRGRAPDGQILGPVPEITRRLGIDQHPVNVADPDLPGTEPIAVFTASLLSYLTADARAAFAAQLKQAAKRRRIARIFAEAPGLVAATIDLNVTALDGPLARRNSRYLVAASLRSPGSGGRDDALLALADPYLRWLAPARHPADDFRWADDERP